MDVEQLRITANKLVYLSTKLPSNEAPERKGGELTIALRDMGEIRIVPVGTVMDMDKASMYKRFSQEKAHRLYSDWLRNPETISSWQTRQEEIDRYGGAVLFYDSNSAPGIISFSGLKEHVDEAVSLSIGKAQGWIDDNLIGKIIRVSKNLVFPEMWDAYEKNRKD